MLREHDHSTDEEAIRNFEADQAAEREIRTREWIAHNYDQRLKAEPKMTAE